MADLVHRRPAKILAEEEILDLALGRLVEIDSAFVEQLDQNVVGIFRVDARVHAAVTAHARRVAR